MDWTNEAQIAITTIEKSDLEGGTEANGKIWMAVRGRNRKHHPFQRDFFRRSVEPGRARVRGRV